MFEKYLKYLRIIVQFNLIVISTVSVAHAYAPKDCPLPIECGQDELCICTRYRYDAAMDTCLEDPNHWSVPDCVDCGNEIVQSRNILPDTPCASLPEIGPGKDYLDLGQGEENPVLRTISVYIQDISQTLPINVLEYKGWYCLAENGYDGVHGYFEGSLQDQFWLLTGFSFNIDYQDDEDIDIDGADHARDAIILGWPKDRAPGYLNDQDVCMQKAIWRHWVRKITFDHFYETDIRIPHSTSEVSCGTHPGYHLNLLYATVNKSMTSATGSSGHNGGYCDMVNYMGISAAYDQKYGKNNLDDFGTIAHEATHSWQDARWTSFRDDGKAITWSVDTWINSRVKEWFASLYLLTFPEYYYLFLPPYGKVFARNPFVTDNECETDVDCECIKDQRCNADGDTDGDLDLEGLNCENCYAWTPEDPMPGNVVCSRASCNSDDECGRGVCNNGRCSERSCNIQECGSHADCPGDFVCNAGYCQEYAQPLGGIWTTSASPEDNGRFDCASEWFVYDREEIRKNGWDFEQWKKAYEADSYLGREELGSVLVMLQVPWQIVEWPNMHDDFPLQDDMFGRNPYSGVELDVFPSSVVRKALLHAEAHLMDSMTKRIANGGYSSSKYSQYSFDAIDVYLWFYDGFRTYVDSSWDDQQVGRWRKSVDRAFASIGIYHDMEKCDRYSYSPDVLLTGPKYAGTWDVSRHGYLDYLSDVSNIDRFWLPDLLLPPREANLQVAFASVGYSPYVVSIVEDSWNLFNVRRYTCCLPDACLILSSTPPCANVINIPACVRDECLSQSVGGVNQSPMGPSFSISVRSVDMLPGKNSDDFKYISIDSIKDPSQAENWYYWGDSGDGIELSLRSIQYQDFFMMPDDWSQIIISNQTDENDNFYRLEYTDAARLPMKAVRHALNAQNNEQDITFNYCVCEDAGEIINKCREDCKYSDSCLDECLVNSCTNCNVEESMYNTYEAQGIGGTTWKYLHPACPTVGDCSTALSDVIGVTYHGEDFSSQRASKEYFWNWYDEIVKDSSSNVPQNSVENYLVLVRMTYQSSKNLTHGFYLPDRQEYDANHFQFNPTPGNGPSADIDYKPARILKPLILQTPHELNCEVEVLPEKLHPRKEWFFDYQISNPITDIWIDFGYVFEDDYRDRYFPFGFQAYTVDLNKLYYQGQVEPGIGQQELNHTDYAVGAGFDASGSLVRYIWGGINRQYLTETGSRFPDNENHAENGLYMVRHHADTERYTYTALYEATQDADDAPLGVVGGHVFYYNHALTEESREDSDTYGQGKILVLGGKTEPTDVYQSGVYSMALGTGDDESWTVENGLNYEAAYSTEVQIEARKFLLLGGQVSNTEVSDSIYELDLSGYAPELRLLPITLPTPRADVAVGYDPIKERLYIFGGREISQSCSIIDMEYFCLIENTLLGDFYAVEDRIPRACPWMNEPGGGIVVAWNASKLHTASIVSNTMWSGCVNTAAGS